MTEASVPADEAAAASADDSAGSRSATPLWLAVTIAALFGALYAYDVWEAVGNLVGLNLQASAQYRIMDNVGIGVSYRYVDYDLDVEKDTYVATFDYQFTGPSFFIEIGF